MYFRLVLCAGVLAVACLLSGTASAQPAADADANPPPATGESAPQSFLEIVHAGGVVGYVIMLLSVVGLALALEHAMTIRQGVLMPDGLAEKARDAIKQGQFAQAEQACKLQPSVLAYVLQAGLSEVDGGWSAVEKAMEDALADQSARLFRKIEYLSVIGNIAPMLGLLGTVIGMVMAFREVALTQGAARAADLAEGIYLALVTTVQGLIVAIPSLSAFAFFRNRVDQYIAETAYLAQHVFTPLKRARRRRGIPPASTSPGAPTERKA